MPVVPQSIPVSSGPVLDILLEGRVVVLTGWESLVGVVEFDLDESAHG